MEKAKDKIIKKYYNSLVISILLYFALSILLHSLHIVNIIKYIFFYIMTTIIYYLIVKNTLQNYFNNKIAEIDEEFKKKNDEYKRLSREKYKIFTRSNKKWYKNITFLYILVIGLIVAMYYIMK